MQITILHCQYFGYRIEYYHTFHSQSNPHTWYFASCAILLWMSWQPTSCCSRVVQYWTRMGGNRSNGFFFDDCIGINSITITITITQRDASHQKWWFQCTHSHSHCIWSVTRSIVTTIMTTMEFKESEWEVRWMENNLYKRKETNPLVLKSGLGQTAIYVVLLRWSRPDFGTVEASKPRIFNINRTVMSQKTNS
jgi:hypothetical protein